MPKRTRARAIDSSISVPPRRVRNLSPESSSTHTSNTLAAVTESLERISDVMTQIVQTNANVLALANTNTDNGQPNIIPNGDAIPVFDPSDKNQTMAKWLVKIDELREINQWSLELTSHYALARLKGLAASWCIHCDSCKECIPRRKTHITLLGKCVGYFNHRYFLVIVFYSMLYSANAVAIDLVYYNKILDKCDLLVAPISFGFYLESHEEGVVGGSVSVGVGNVGNVGDGGGGGWLLLFLFFFFACTKFFILISTIFILTTETEFILTGKLKHEIDAAEKYNYDRGIKKNLICVLGYRWYMALLCPMARSKIPDMHAVLYRVGQQPAKFTL